MKNLIVVFLLGSTAQAKEVFLFHYGDTVRLTEKCNPNIKFFNVCEELGRVVDYHDSKNECYPLLTYVVEFEIKNKKIQQDFCGKELILRKEKNE